MPACVNCHSKFPNRLVIGEIVRNLSSRKFCLVCSPFGKHNTTKNICAFGIKKCPSCTQELPLNNFYKKGKNGRSCWCIKCSKKESLNRQRTFKARCIEYKGGKCEKCCYDKCPAAMDFHHNIPDQKEFSISKRRSYTFNEEVQKELDKCSLLCANCHREAHFML